MISSTVCALAKGNSRKSKAIAVFIHPIARHFTSPAGVGVFRQIQMGGAGSSFRPISLSIPNTEISALGSGADPLVRAGPPGPALRKRNQVHPNGQADEGVGCGARGQPHPT